MTGIRKTFGRTVALDGVDLTVGAREVHGLLGGNGAGKTTLMNVLYGLYAPDGGTIEIDGKPMAIDSPKAAIAAGVGMVHQSFLQVDSFTVAENVMLGTDSRSAGGSPRARVAELSERFGLAVDPDRRVEELPVGVRQRVEILKALYRGARILILDEPTTNLTPQEVDQLFESMRTIVDEGMSIILITHKIRETMAACDRMTVMRDGRRISTVDAADTDPDDLATRMVGEAGVGDPRLRAEIPTLVGETEPAMTPAVAPEVSKPAAVVIERATAVTSGREISLRPVDLTVGRGEIVGIAGVAGNGQVELAEALTGVRKLAAGSFRLDGQELVGRATAGWLDRGVVYVPEDRQRDGILPAGSISENLVLGNQRARATAGLIDWAAARSEAGAAIVDFSIRAPGPSTPAGQLSGGNIQRVILARAFSRNPRILVLHNPTRGLDIPSTAFVYEKIRSAAAQGCAVVVISEDLDEVIALADRMLVIYSGELVGERHRGQIDPYEVGRMMVGVA